jgi:hypothetical protein
MIYVMRWQPRRYYLQGPFPDEAAANKWTAECVEPGISEVVELSEAALLLSPVRGLLANQAA